MKGRFSDIFEYRHLLIALTHKELTTKYGSSMGGFLWMIINPLAYLIVLSTIFTYFVPLSISHYPLFLFSALLPWMFMIGTLSSVTSSLAVHADLLKKSSFPRIIIPLAGFLAQTLQFFLTLVVFFMIFFFLELVHLGPGMIWINVWSIIFPIVLECIFLLGIVLLTSRTYVFFRDISFIINAFALLWFYITPIIYPLSYVPKVLLPLYGLNPMVGIVELYRFSFLGYPIAHVPVIFSIVVSLAVFAGGLYLFIADEKKFTDYL